MPKVPPKAKYPEGWDIVADTLDELEKKMREGC
jgi:hypothetical protein